MLGEAADKIRRALGKTTRTLQGAAGMVDEEFRGEHGTTVSERSPGDEAVHHEPLRPMEVAEKIRDEAAAGRGPVDKARRALHELDREIAGDRRRRQDPTTVPPSRRTG
jgi:hypothetical protein